MLHGIIKICNGSNAGTIQIQFGSEVAASSATWREPIMIVTRLG